MSWEKGTDKEHVAYTQNRILKGNHVIFNSMDELKGHTKENKPGIERQILYDFIYT